VVADFSKIDTVQTKSGTIPTKINTIYPKFSEKKLKLMRSDFFQPTAEFLNTDCGDWFIPSKNLVETVSMRFMI
jgi:hypothetical protein